MNPIAIFIILITIVIASIIIWKFHHEPNVVIAAILIAILIIVSTFYLTCLMKHSMLPHGQATKTSTTILKEV